VNTIEKLLGALGTTNEKVVQGRMEV